ncbi:MAG: ComEC/Rec2 family competence protein, partial [Pseudomonadota bacterium]
MSEFLTFLRRYPLLLPLVAFVLGVTLYRTVSPRVSEVLCASCLAVSCLLWWGKCRRAAAFLLLAGALFLGIFRAGVLKEPAVSPGSGPPGVPEGPQIYEARVVNYPFRNGDGFQFETKLHAWLSKGAGKPIEGVVQLALRDRRAPDRGDVIRFRAALHGPRNLGNDAEGDYESYARVRGIDYTGVVGRSGSWGVVRPAHGFLRRGLNRLRADILDRSDLFLGAESSALLKCLVFGAGKEVPDELREAFRRAGVLHLLVVSGFHVSLVFLIAAFLGGFLATRSAFLVRRFPVFYARILSGLLGAGLFCALTNLPIPTFRALAMALVGVVLVCIRRRVDPIAVWLAVAAAVLAWQPLYLYDPSAQLSFLAVLGILVTVRVVRDREKSRVLNSKRRLEWLRLSFLTALGATLFTFPALVFHFHRISVWTLLGNLLFVPLFGSVSTALGVAAAYLTGPFSFAGNYLLLCFEQWNSFVL